MTNTILANIVSDVPGLEVLAKIYPLQHEHKFKNLMKEKILRHIEPTIDLSEMETANMVKILETLSLRYLELLSQRLSGDEKSEYARALFGIEFLRDALQLFFKAHILDSKNLFFSILYNKVNGFKRFHTSLIYALKRNISVKLKKNSREISLKQKSM